MSGLLPCSNTSTLHHHSQKPISSGSPFTACLKAPVKSPCSYQSIPAEPVVFLSAPASSTAFCVIPDPWWRQPHLQCALGWPLELPACVCHFPGRMFS